MNEFYVGEFRVDIARSQIIAQEDILAMEPKVLQVLVVLAKHQGEVVSHETILNEVWQNVVVAPNALQRCIAQLRKAFGDDAKRQATITTHPKVGYSLTLPVQWNSNKSSPSKADKSASVQTKYLTIALFISCICMVIFGLFFWQSDPTPLQLSKVQALTATDKREFYPRFSPDGQYVSFVRSSGPCKNQVWLKALDDGTEYLLSPEFSQFGPASWSADGSQIVFTAAHQCSQVQLLGVCREIRRINVALSMSAPKISEPILSCGRYTYEDVAWISNTSIAFVEKDANSDRVASLQIPDGGHRILYQREGKKLNRLTYSHSKNLLAITQTEEKDLNRLILIKPGEDKYKEVKLALPFHTKDFNWWIPSWHPSGESLLASGGNKLYDIHLDGSVTTHSIPTIENLHTPMYHPDGKRIVTAMGVSDLDAMEISWLNNSETLKTIDRSTMLEVSTKYQPGGKSIAFISMRSGSEQIWLNENGKARQLTHLQDATLISFDWSNDGKIIALVAHNKLHILQLDGQLQILPHTGKVYEIFQWVGEHKLLLRQIDNNQHKIVLFDIQSQQSELLHVGAVSWAQVGEDDRFYFSTEKNILNSSQQGQRQALVVTQELPVKGKFIYHQQHILLTDENKNIWLVDLDQSNKQRIYAPEEGEYIYEVEDIDLLQKRLLFSKSVSARKEIVIFE